MRCGRMQVASGLRVSHVWTALKDVSRVMTAQEPGLGT